jgi:hypothetical protein
MMAFGQDIFRWRRPLAPPGANGVTLVEGETASPPDRSGVSSTSVSVAPEGHRALRLWASHQLIASLPCPDRLK